MTRAPSRRGIGFKPSLRDQQRQNKLNMELYRTGPEQHPDIVKLFADVKPKRERGPNKPRTAEMGKPESVVQKEILDWLGGQVNVNLAIRINSGAVQSDKYYVEFNRVYIPARYRVSFPQTQPKMRISDILVLMGDGRLCAIEAKNERWMQSDGDGEKAIREREQWNFLEHVRIAGGVGLFARCVDDVKLAFIAGGYYTNGG